MLRVNVRVQVCMVATGWLSKLSPNAAGRAMSVLTFKAKFALLRMVSPSFCDIASVIEGIRDAATATVRILGILTRGPACPE